MSEVEAPVKINTLDTASLPFVGQWNRLISTTNWEKGHIILTWREALLADGAAAGDYADDAWAQRVGGVSGQHVGRLRRAYERFGAVYEQYEGLYWSHFQTAIDWDDAEMWLEGAVQNRWSVAAMRRQRSETLGELVTDSVQPSSDLLEEFDESLAAGIDLPTSATLTETTTHVQQAERGQTSTVPSDALADENELSASDGVDENSTAAAELAHRSNTAQRANDLASLPDDLVDAFEAFKLVILRYRAEPWTTCSPDDVTNVLMALQELALAPAEAEA